MLTQRGSRTPPRCEARSYPARSRFCRITSMTGRGGRNPKNFQHRRRSFAKPKELHHRIHRHPLARLLDRAEISMKGIRGMGMGKRPYFEIIPLPLIPLFRGCEWGARAQRGGEAIGVGLSARITAAVVNSLSPQFPARALSTTWRKGGLPHPKFLSLLPPRVGQRVWLHLISP